MLQMQKIHVHVVNAAAWTDGTWTKISLLLMLKRGQEQLKKLGAMPDCQIQGGSLTVQENRSLLS